MLQVRLPHVHSHSTSRFLKIGLFFGLFLGLLACDCGGDLGGDSDDKDDARDAALDGGDEAALECAQPCPNGFRCRYGSCVPNLGSCDSNDDCKGDSYCCEAAHCEGECLPYGVPPSKTHDPECRRREVLEEILPTSQCEWPPPGAEGSIHDPGSVNVYTTPIVADLNLDRDPHKLQPSIILTSFEVLPSRSDFGAPADIVWDAAVQRMGMLRIFDGRTCEEQLHFGGRDGAQYDPNDLENIYLIAHGTQLVAIDLDGDVGEPDGRPEIIALKRARVFELNPVGGRTTILQLVALKIHVDEDGRASASEHWVGRDCATGSPIELATEKANYGPGAWDLDDDGKPEIVLGGMVFDHQGCLLNTPDIEEDLIDPYIGWGPMVTVADVNGDGRPELITGKRIASWNAATNEWEDAEYFDFDCEALGFPGAEYENCEGHVAIADLGQYSELPGHPIPNDLPEIVVVSAATWSSTVQSTGTIRAQTLDGRVIFGPRKVFDYRGDHPDYAHPAPHPNGHGGIGGPPTIADFDGDGYAEFAAAAGQFYAVYDPDCEADAEALSARPAGECIRSERMLNWPLNADEREGVLWAQLSQDVSSNATGSSVFDFNGDGQAEVVYRDECYVRVYDGGSGEVLFSAPASNGTGFEYPVIADVDGDFATEIIVPRSTFQSGDACPAQDPLFEGSSYEHRGGFIVYRDPEDRWANSRPIWNQHAYSVTHVDESGAVVRTRDWVQNWRAEGLNHFRQNVQGDLGFLNIADLTVVFYRVNELCTTPLPATLELEMKVCNRGSNPVTDGVLVHYIERDGEDERVVCATETTRLLMPGECEELACAGDVNRIEDLFVKADPNEEIADCRPENNEAISALVFCGGPG